MGMTIAQTYQYYNAIVFFVSDNVMQARDLRELSTL